MREVCTKNFFVVCDCGDIIKPKRIKKISVQYYEPTDKKRKSPSDKKKKEKEKDKRGDSQEPEQKEENKISQEVLESVSKDLLALGFTEAESYELINKSYELIGVEDRVELVKKSISLASTK